MTAVKGTVAGTSDRGARVPMIPPPLYYVAAFGAGGLLHAAAPLPIGAAPLSVVAGVGALFAGVALAGSGVAGVVQHRTTIVPHHTVTKLVTTGGYRLSRNPMYAGLASAYVGGALIMNSWWPIASLSIALIAVRQLVIGPEEVYLAARFGQAYLDCQARVRRWL